MFLLSTRVALACGGFFCNNTEPVDQSAERILFAQDPTTGEVETHVQVFYEGPSESFAWVVPMPSQPEIFVSSDALFDDLADGYAPAFERVLETVGDCTGWLSDSDGLNDYDYGGYGQNGGGGYGTSAPVVVVDTKKVGAYETVTLQASDRDALVDWLVANDYDLPDAIGPALDPYVAGGSYFVAMRLGKDADTGDLQPIGFRYLSQGLTVPIRMTAIAARPDTRLEVYVLGDHRAVPESYLHVQINQAAIHWFSGADNYDEVVTQAANEAGGHAFATDYAGPSYLVDDRWYRAEQYDTAAIAAAATPADAVMAVQEQFEPTVFLLGLLEDFVPPPPGVEATAWFNSPWYFDLPPDYTWDPEGLADALEERVVEPMVRVGGLFERYPTMTRLTSSLDAAEMTVDPVFAFNREMPEQPRGHTAIERFLCGDGTDYDDAPRELELPDGRIIDLPSIAWLDAHGLTEDEYLEPLGRQAALIIEQTSGTEEPIVLVDNSDEQTTLADGLTSTATAPLGKVEGEGCGCQSSKSIAWVGLFAFLLPGRRRRG